MLAQEDMKALEAKTQTDSEVPGDLKTFLKLLL